MKYLFAALLFVLAFVLSGPAYAAPAAKLQADGLTIVLTPAPCTNAKILDMIDPDFRAQFRAAGITWQGEPLKACWAAAPDSEEVVIVDETGYYGTVPMKLFKFVEET